MSENTFADSLQVRLDALRTHCTAVEHAHLEKVRENLALRAELEAAKRDLTFWKDCHGATADALTNAQREAQNAREELPKFLESCEREAAHIERNGTTLRVQFGEEHEGRCRELCAMYLREFIVVHKMNEQLKTLDLTALAKGGNSNG